MVAPGTKEPGETINLSIVSDKQQKATVQLFNLAGVLVMSEAINLTPANNVYTFSLPQGLYICRVMVGDKSFAERLVVL